MWVHTPASVAGITKTPHPRRRGPTPTCISHRAQQAAPAGRRITLGFSNLEPINGSYNGFVASEISSHFPRLCSALLFLLPGQTTALHSTAHPPFIPDLVIFLVPNPSLLPLIAADPARTLARNLRCRLGTSTGQGNCPAPALPTKQPIPPPRLHGRPLRPSPTASALLAPIPFAGETRQLSWALDRA